VHSADVLIAGAGIIGLSIALELADRGLRVTVLERGQAMAEASWAAAGMLAAHDPENPRELQPLSDLSISLYPDYLNTVERLSGLQIPLRTSGTLLGAGHDDRFQDALASSEIAQYAPDLKGGGRSFLWIDEHSLEPRDLCTALPEAVAAAGVRLIGQAPVTRIRSISSGVEVSTPERTWSAMHFINCCGAWAEVIANVPAIEPRKGQMVAVQLPSHRRLDCVIRTPELYLVPRGDGRVVIGASVERAGFDKSVQDTTIQALFDEAAALWPPIQEAQIIETWAGLRPGSTDEVPIIGPCGDENCWIASGHFRNGILLAPGTARVMRELILKEPPSIDLTGFRCDRFAAASVS
jgi:glycine oxidase